MKKPILSIPDKQRQQEIAILVKGNFEEVDTATIGENRKQLFVRLPQTISKRLKLGKGDTVRFTTAHNEGKQYATMEKVKDGTS